MANRGTPKLKDFLALAHWCQKELVLADWVIGEWRLKQAESGGAQVLRGCIGDQCGK